MRKTTSEAKAILNSTNSYIRVQLPHILGGKGSPFHVVPIFSFPFSFLSSGRWFLKRVLIGLVSSVNIFHVKIK